MCLQAGEHGLAVFAVVAAIFHLFTHAFFKALLFLSAGSVMHAMGNVIDMRRFSGLRKVLPYTHWTFLCGALALAGVFPLSGFWSKDDILASALQAHEAAGNHSSIYLLLFGAGLVTAALTAFYTFRAYFRTFWGELKLPPEAGAHGHDDHGHEHPAPTQHHQPVAHESPPLMTIPLMILAVFALGIGITLTLFSHNSFAHFLEHTLTNEVYHLPEPHDHYEWLAMGLSVLIAVGGVGVAYWMYLVNPAIPKQLAAQMQPLYQLSLNKFYIDEIYGAFIIAPLNALAGGSYGFDQHVVDGFVDWFGQSPTLLGRLFRPVQNGLVQFYALAMLLGLTVFLLAACCAVSVLSPRARCVLQGRAAKPVEYCSSLLGLRRGPAALYRIAMPTLLLCLLLVPLASAILVALLGEKSAHAVRWATLASTLVSLAAAVIIAVTFAGLCRVCRRHSSTRRCRSRRYSSRK